MPSNHAYDSQEFEQLYLPYAPNLSKLAGKPVFYTGNNMFCTWGGTQKKRPPMTTIGPVTQLTNRCDRLWVYETLEAQPNVYIVGSFYDSINSIWFLQYFNLGQVNPTWAVVGERRACNHSTLPHEGIVRRGKLYIKAFPLNAGMNSDVLGSIVLDGTNGLMQTHDWGAIGPIDAVALSNPGSWSPSANPVTVLNGWLYTYTWVMQSGNETDRAPLQTNPSLSPSGTGPFTNAIPSMTIVGPDDTSEYPFLNVYRTTDGGGTFFLLQQVVNVGGSQTFLDTYEESGSGGGVFSDPTPDTQLNTTAVSPTTESNGPPPTVAPPGVTGADSIEPCTRIVEYAGRLWYGIQEYLFYSALEELNTGVPEECWPAGDQLPNFYRMPKGIAQLEVTPSGLLVTTRTETIRIEGTNKASFNPVPFLGGIGGAALQNRASTEAGDYAAWVTQDFRVVVVHGDSYAVLSNPIGDQIEQAADNGDQIDIKFWAHGDKEWLVVGCHDQNTPANTRWQIYDMNLSRTQSDDFWFVPWIVQSSALAVGQPSYTSSDNNLFVMLWDGTYARLAYMNLNATDYEDLTPATGTGTSYGWDLTTGLLGVPEGDHVNQLRAPDFSPTLASVQIERIAITGDTDPDVALFYDNMFTGTPVDLGVGDIPARRKQSEGYTTLTFNEATKVCKHVAIQITGNNDSLGAELFQISLNWLPDSGA